MRRARIGRRAAALLALLAWAWCADAATPVPSVSPSEPETYVIWLTTHPIPRDQLVAGNTVELRYVIATPFSRDCKTILAGTGDTIYVRLEERGPHVTTPERRKVAASQAVACRDTPAEPSAGERWLMGHISRDTGKPRVTYGIERYTIPDKHALGPLPTGSVIAKVEVDGILGPDVLELIPVWQPPD